MAAVVPSLPHNLRQVVPAICLGITTALSASHTRPASTERWFSSYESCDCSIPLLNTTGAPLEAW